MKPIKFFNSEKKPLFQKKVAREFNFMDFLRFILIRISIEVQLIHWKLIYLNFRDCFRCLKMFLEKVVPPRIKKNIKQN